MAWGFGSVAAVAHAINTNVTPLTVPYPAGNVGDLVLLICRSRGSSVTQTPSDAAYQELVAVTSNGTLRVFGVIATGTGSGTLTVSTSSATTLSAQVARFTGGPSSLTGLVHATNTSNGSGDTNIPRIPALTITQPNALVLIVGGKNINGGSVDAEPGFTEIIDASTATGSGQMIVANYVIQIAAANISSGTWSVGGTDSAASANGVVLALLTDGTFPRPALGTLTRLGLHGTTRSIGPFTKAVASFVAVDVTDTWLVSATEDPVDENFIISGDTWRTSWSEVSAVVKQIDVTDTWRTAWSESVALNISGVTAKDVTDTWSVTATEGTTDVFVTINATDTWSVTLTGEAGTVEVSVENISVTDTWSVSATESDTSVTIFAGFNDINVTDDWLLPFSFTTIKRDVSVGPPVHAKCVFRVPTATCKFI